MNDKIKAIALCRVSTVKQSIEGSSLEAQEQRVYDAAMYLNAEIVQFWGIKRSSRKGKNYQRKDLLEMLAVAKADKKIKYIIVDEPDRFMREFDVYYYWKVVFREQAGAKLVYAKKPHLADEDNIMTLMEEMMDVFRAEASNLERITKTTSNMQAKVKQGYFPGRTKPGYKMTATPGFFEPLEPDWSILRESFMSVLLGATVKEVVRSVNEKGYRTRSGKLMDTYNFKKILRDPYYAGIIAMSSWEVNPNGLHKPMITIEQHEQLKALADGIVYKPRKKFRSDFCLSNLMDCKECIGRETRKAPRLVGYDHSNGKKGNSLKRYKRYRCRNCGLSMLQEELHGTVSDELLGLEIVPSRKDEFIGALRQVWEQDASIVISRSKGLQRRLDELKTEKNTAVRNSLNNRFNEDDIKAVLDVIDADIKHIESEMRELSDIENDFVDFVDFSMEFAESLRERFWELDAEHLGWCKQLLFPEGFSISRDKKVYTPKISDFYRLTSNQKDPERSSESNMVGDRGFEPLTSSTSMKRSSQMS